MTDSTDREALHESIANSVQPILMDFLPKAIARARSLDVADAVLTVLPAVATARELELRQRTGWSTSGRCPMCGWDETGGHLCADCASTVRHLPSLQRRQWRRYEPVATDSPIQGSGYTPAQLLGVSTEEAEGTEVHRG